MPHFASFRNPMTDLTKAHLSNIMRSTTRANEAFQELKAELCMGPMLVSPDFTKENIIYTDTPETGVLSCLRTPSGGH